MKTIRKFLDLMGRFAESSALVAKFTSVFKALDEFFYGTGKVTDLPHVLDHMDIKRFMSFVIIALIPATIASIYFWGLRVLLIILTSYVFGGVVEVAFAILRGKDIHEGFLVTGLIFPLTLPPTVPLWMVAVGIIFGTLFGKEVFGGTGRNIFNPALVGRVFLTISFPNIMSGPWFIPFWGGTGGLGHYQGSLDALTLATPLKLFRDGTPYVSYVELLFGRCPGCIGETFRIGIILGGIFLILTKISNWRMPLSILISVALFSTIGNLIWSSKVAPPMYQFLSGGLLLGTFFMATDPVTCPITRLGKWIAGILTGLLIVLIRGFSGFVEGVMFSILMMNLFSPLIDRLIIDMKYRRKTR